MIKICPKCGTEMSCLKTGFFFAYKDQYHHGDLFGCRACGTMSVHGIPIRGFVSKIEDLSEERPMGRVVSCESVSELRNRMVLKNVSIAISKEFLEFMIQWNPDFLPRHPLYVKDKI